MQKKQTVIIILIVALVLLNIFFVSQWILAMQKVKTLSTKVNADQKNAKIISFVQLLTNGVLNGSKEVSFDDRLNLEKAVRDLNDQEIFNSWQKFTQSSGAQTQQSFVDLIKILLKKISY